MKLNEGKNRFTYSYDLVDGHIIANVEGAQMLIDTGAPFSVARSSQVRFAGQEVEAQENYMGVTVDVLSRNVGTAIDALVGVDLLNLYDIRVDPESNSLMVSSEELLLSGQVLEISQFMGIPIVGVEVDGHELAMFLDTGAKLSYIDPEVSVNFPRRGREEDFYPGVGNFTTDVHSIPVELGTEELTLPMGTLPDLLQLTLMMGGVSGILGTALLKTHRVTLAPRRKAVANQRLH